MAHSLLVAQCHLYVVELCILQFLSHMFKGVLELVFQVLRVGPAVGWRNSRHVAVKIPKGRREGMDEMFSFAMSITKALNSRITKANPGGLNEDEAKRNR